MRIGVIGAGAVGGTLAALLDRAGQTVEVTARGAHLAAIQADGLRLEGGWGEHTARVRAGETLTREPEFVILATKAQDARSALEANKLAIRSVPVLVVQNGLGGLRIAREVLPSAPLLGGLALMAVSYLQPGVVTVTTPQPLIVGAGVILATAIVSFFLPAGRGTHNAEMDAVTGMDAADRELISA